MKLIDIFNTIKKYKEKCPVDVRNLIKDLDINLCYEDLGDELSGIIKKEDEIYRIVVNEKDSFTRKKFTMAHALGHYIFHRAEIKESSGIADNRKYRSIDTEKYHSIERKGETLANRFAADLLMPQPLIDELKEKGITDYKEVADALQVSQEAMRIRLEP